MKTLSTRFLLWIAVFILLLAIVAVVMWKRYTHVVTTVDLALATQCDLHQQPCSSSDGHVTLTLAIQPQPIPPLHPLAVSVRVEGTPADAVAVEFNGVEMAMGYNRIDLHVDAGHFVGTGVLPVCTVDRMVWEAVVWVSSADRRYRAPFRFVVTR